MMTTRDFENEAYTFLPQLRSFLYRLTCDKALASDLALETVLKVVSKLNSFQNAADLKIGVFSIAVELAQQNPNVQWRFNDNALDKCQEVVRTELNIFKQIADLLARIPQWSFRIVEHINFCFTCMAKTLSLEGQITVLLADIYNFTRKEVAKILGKSKETIQQWLEDGRNVLQEKLHNRCSFINKNASCHYCAETNDLFNAQKDSSLQIAVLPFASVLDHNPLKLLQLRTSLIKTIDPLQIPVSMLHDAMLKILQEADR